MALFYISLFLSKSKVLWDFVCLKEDSWDNIILNQKIFIEGISDVILLTGILSGLLIEVKQKKHSRIALLFFVFFIEGKSDDYSDAWYPTVLFKVFLWRFSDRKHLSFVHSCSSFLWRGNLWVYSLSDERNMSILCFFIERNPVR